MNDSSVRFTCLGEPIHLLVDAFRNLTVPLVGAKNKSLINCSIHHQIIISMSLRLHLVTVYVPALERLQVQTGVLRKGLQKFIKLM
jgi:hypothetical protein